VFMLEDSPYCSMRCRPDTPGSAVPMSSPAPQPTLRARRSAASQLKLCEMGSQPPRVEREAFYEFDRGEVAEVLDLQSDSWPKCRITDLGPKGTYSVKVLDTELAARHGLVGMEADEISPAHLRKAQPTTTTCATSVLFAGRVVLSVAAKILLELFSLGASLGHLSLYERLRSWFVARRRRFPEETKAKGSTSSMEEDSSVADLATARFSRTPRSSPKETTPFKFSRTTSAARSEVSTVASVTISRHTSDGFIAHGE